MITLITGTPGAGKTLYSLRFIRDLEKSYRMVYAHGITGLKFEHEIVVCDSKTCDFCQSLPDYETYKKVKDWNSFADDGSVFFIDECQHIYRNKGSMSVSEFETHRHKGFDFFLVTQHPMLINTDLRRLVGRHIHLIADFLGRHQYEWVECSQNLSKTNAIKSKYKLDKSLFALYHSASVHTKQQKKFPFVVYVFIASIFLAAFFIYKLKTRLTAKTSLPVEQSQSQQVQPGQQKNISNDSAAVDYESLLRFSTLDHMNYYPSSGYKFYFVSGSQSFDSSILIQNGFKIIKGHRYEVTITKAPSFSVTVTK